MRGMSTTGRMPNWLLGIVLLIFIGVGSVIAYTKELPFSNEYEIHAVFASPQTIRANSPVRIAGVEVGRVSDLELIEESVGAGKPGEPRQAVRMTMELADNGREIREDATFEVRPRLFLDGNYFVDVHPGSPSAEQVSEGHTFDITQTAVSVQIDQLLGILQSEVRTDIRTFLDQFGNALIDHGGAKGLRELFRSSPKAYRYSAQVAEAQLGTERFDLRGNIDGLGRVLRGLSRNQLALSDLVTNLRRVSGAFAAEDVALGQAIELLPGFLAEGEPTFTAISDALPSVRAFAREALPGVKKSPEALRKGLPLLRELRGLMSRSELRGLVSRLRPTVPALVELVRGNTGLFGQQRAFSSCFNEVIIPWSNQRVTPPEGYPLPVTGRTYEATGYALTGSAGESRNGDAAGQHLRVLGASGSNVARFGETPGRDETFALTPFPILGAIPRLTDSQKTAYRPDVPCETQDIPNLEAGVAAPPTQSPAPASADLDEMSGPGADQLRELLALAEQIKRGTFSGTDNPKGRRLLRDAQELLDQLGLGGGSLKQLLETSR